MGRVTAYETTDGRLFKERADYLQAQRDYIAGLRMTRLIEAQVVDPEVAAKVAEFYCDNVGALRNLLNSKDLSEAGAPAEDDESPAEPGTAEPAGEPVTPVDVTPEI